jgi:hypothetical protein
MALSNRYPKYNLPSKVDELNSLEVVFNTLDLQGQYEKGAANSDVDKRHLEWLFDRIFALVGNTTSFFWLYKVVVEREGKDDEKQNEIHSQMTLHLLRGYYLLDQGKRFSEKDIQDNVELKKGVLEWHIGYTGFSVDDFRGNKRKGKGKKVGTLFSMLKCGIVKSIYKRMSVNSLVDQIKFAIDGVYDKLLKPYGKAYERGDIDVNQIPRRLQNIPTLDPGYLGTVWTTVYEEQTFDLEAAVKTDKERYDLRKESKKQEGRVLSAKKGRVKVKHHQR